MTDLREELAALGSVDAGVAYERIVDALWLDPPHSCGPEERARMVLASLRPENQHLSLPSLFKGGCG